MEKRKAIVTTVLMFGLLAATDACLYALHSRLFIFLTGAAAAYGFVRGAVDFCQWQYKTAPVNLTEVTPVLNPDKDAEIVRVLTEEV